MQRGSRDNITVVAVDLRRGPDAPSLAAVLAAQCSEEVALTPQRTGERRGGRVSESAGGGEGGAGGGAVGGLAGSMSSAVSWLSGLLFRHAHDPYCGAGRAGLGCSGGAGAFGAGATTGGGCVFRATSVAARGPRMSLRRASTVTPVGVYVGSSLRPCKGSSPALAGLEWWGGKQQGDAPAPEAPRAPGVQRSLSFSTYELGHVLRRTRIECDEPAPLRLP